MKMTRDRIMKISCAVCGSRHKQFLTLSCGADVIGYAKVCCDCGHIKRYVRRVGKDVSSPENTFHLTNMIKSDYTISNIECGTSKAFCRDRKCKYWIDYRKDPHYHFGKEPGNYGCNSSKKHDHCKHHKKHHNNHGNNSVYKPSFCKENNSKIKKYV